MRWLIVMTAGLVACGSEDGAILRDSASTGVGGDGGNVGVGAGGAGGATTTTVGATSGGAGGEAPCPAGVICVDSFPFTDTRDSTLGQALFDTYGCDPDTDESGPEIVYRLTLPEAGFVSAAVYPDAGVDIDVHILGSLDAADCLDRGHHHAGADVPAGQVWVVADTWVDDDGLALAGAFEIDIGFLAPSVGPCDMLEGEMPRVGDEGDHLAMPATGPMVLEAHLVTQDEPPPYPSTPTEELLDHYALSQSVSGLVMYRRQDWAPLEGGSFYGAGIGSPTAFPTLHEAWYVNMYWTSEARPEKGRAMILRDPGTERAVVVAAGYETGPGNLTRIGGTPEETHFYLGTTHLDVLQLGLAADDTLPIGPRRCTD